MKDLIDELNGEEEFVQNKVDEVGEEEGEEKMEEDLEEWIEHGEEGEDDVGEIRDGRVSESLKELIPLIRKRREKDGAGMREEGERRGQE